jgi:hypothetical protein
MTNEGQNPNALLTELNEVQSQYNQIGLEDLFSGTVGALVKDLDLYFAQSEQQMAGILSSAESLGINLQRAAGGSFRNAFSKFIASLSIGGIPGPAAKTDFIFPRKR